MPTLASILTSIFERLQASLILQTQKYPDPSPGSGDRYSASDSASCRMALTSFGSSRPVVTISLIFSRSA
jgi:hypothetical protein